MNEYRARFKRLISHKIKILFYSQPVFTENTEGGLSILK